MKILNELSLKFRRNDKTIFFGLADEDDELNQMFKLRYEVYNNLKYLNPELNLTSDKDFYDAENKCHYFIAKIDGKIIGTARLIQDDFLPAEKTCFKFPEPFEIKKIPRSQRAEIGRLIVVFLDKGSYLPRNLVTLFLIKSLLDFSGSQNILGGYSFITSNLYNKLSKLRVPFYLIEKYVQIYPREGILYPYFNQKSNPIIPIYFLCKDISQYIDGIINREKMFIKISEKKFILRVNIYNKFLKILGIF